MVVGREEEEEKKKKRKRKSNGKGSSEDIGESNKRFKLSHHDDAARARLIIASGPGITIPTDVSFQAYQKTNLSNPTKNQLLLQSSAHPKLNFTAEENQGAGVAGRIKHYVCILDPRTQILQVVEAPHVSVRSSLRVEDEEMMVQRVDNAETAAVARRALGLEFGTKKAKKAISQSTHNKVVSREEQRGLSPDSLRKANPSASAVLESMEASNVDAPTQEAIQAEVDEAKPRPRHNPAATTSEEAYKVEDVVGEDMMIALKVKPWYTTIQVGEEITVSSRFVARRVKKMVDEDDIKKLKLAKYVLVLEEFLKACTINGKSSMKIPKRDVLKEQLAEPDSVISKLVDRFTTNSKLTKWHGDLIKTTLAVLTLIIDDFNTDTFDLREDLGMKPPEIARYFAEVGAKVRPPAEGTQRDNKWTKAEAGLHGFARLKVPLEFPKPRVVPRSRR